MSTSDVLAPVGRSSPTADDLGMELVDERNRGVDLTARLAAIVESSDDAIIGKTLAGVITSWNAGAERMYGYGADEIVGQNIAVLIPLDRIGELAPILARVSRGERVRHFETKRVRKDGEVREMSVTISPIRDASGAVAGASTVARDITEIKRAETDRRRLETRLHQAQRLESIGQLAGGIAHDFNNLLAAIMNYAFLASASLNDAMTRDGLSSHDGFATIVQDIEEITKVAKRAAALTHQLLIFGHRGVVEPEMLDMNSVVADMEQLLRRTMGPNVDHIRTLLAPDLPPVKADRSRIDQVIMNLAVNARDAMPGGGQLDIATSWFEADEAYSHSHSIAPGTYVRLTVSDTGTGMSQQVAARAFEPFFTTKPEGEGTGWGLATVYGIVAQAHGDVGIYSEPGMGTTVRVDLPTASGPLAAPRRARPNVDVHAKGETVLLVEDEAMVREPTRRMLATQGYTVLAASDGEEAQAVIHGHPGKIDLLLTDVVMPGRSGKELSVDLYEHRPTTKVLFMSGYSRDVIVHQSVLDDGVNLIQKPFSGNDLLVKLRDVLDEG